MERDIIRKGFILGIIMIFFGSGLVSGYTEINKYSGCPCQYNDNEVIENDLNSEYPTMTPIPIELFTDNTYTDIKMIDTPDEFSWKDHNGKDWTTPARTQGNCGSCWLFGAIGALESVIKIKEGCADLNPDLSEQFVLSCIPEAGSCHGGDPYKCAFYYINDTSASGGNLNGLILEKCMTYRSNYGFIPQCSEKDEDWKEFLIPISDFWQSGYWNINNPDLIDNIKSLIYEKGPVYSVYWVTNNFKTWGRTHHKPSDYYKDLDENCPGYVNHGITIVGWKDDSSIGNGGYWIVKNSWGTEWGYDGFFNLEYDCLNMGAFVAWVDYDPNSFDWPADPHSPISPIIQGPTSGKIRTQHEYIISSTDQDDDNLYYTIDWGDGSIQEWIGPYNSGEEITLKHSWKRIGNYKIKVKAIDMWGSQSDWATISVRIPKNIHLTEIPILRFITKLLDFLPLLTNII